MLEVGATFDLRPNKYGDCSDLSKAEDRAKVRSVLRVDKPYLVIGCPLVLSFVKCKEIGIIPTPEEGKERAKEEEAWDQW